ncbi:MAG TPA: paraslipin, partial [Gammaproteobacteria bacterium]|nr:paraslipin [Gammaproteobacteria bacterium]
MDFINLGTLVPIVIAVIVVYVLFQVARVVPQRENFVVERLGKYNKTLSAGFHLLVPFIDRVAYKHTLKEQAVDVPSQSCITRDNIAVEIDGILYIQVVDAQL